MTEVLFSITNDGKFMCARYYTMSFGTLRNKVFTEELVNDVLRRVIENDRRKWRFKFDGMKVYILQIKYDYMIEFFVSRNLLKESDKIYAHLF